MAEQIAEYEVDRWTPARNNPAPLHDQISSHLRQRILSGELPPHYRLRPEPELAEGFGVSRGTLRRALQTLIEDGLLVQVQGRGTFVTSATPEAGLAQELLSLAETLSSQSVPFTTVVRSDTTERAEGQVAQLLEPPSGHVRRIERLRLIEGQPAALLVNYLRDDLVGRFTTDELVSTPLFELIERTAETPIASGRRTFEARPAPDEVAELLALARGGPVLYFEQVTYLATGQAIEYSDVWLRSDQIRLSSVLSRPTRRRS